MIYSILGLVIISMLYVWLFSPLETPDRVGITTAISTGALVIVTSIYAWYTRKMSWDMKEQAIANTRMVEEMREQRISESRPIIIQRVVYRGSDWPDIKIGWTGIVPGRITHGANFYSHFEIQNVGKGPAIGVEVSILNEKKQHIDSFEYTRRTFLKSDDPPLKFSPSFSFLF